MSKLSPEALRKIVEEQLPGHRIVERPRGQDAAGLPPASDAVTPDLATLRRKYFGDEDELNQGIPLARASAADAPVAADESADAAIVYVVPDTGRDDLERGPGPKAVVVSRTTGKVVGLQG